MSTKPRNALNFHAAMAFWVRYPVWVILAITAVTLFFSWQIKDLSFKTTIYDLVIEDHQEYAGYQAFKKQFGSDEIIRVVIKTEDVFDSPTFSRIDGFSDQCALISGIKRVISLPGIKRDIDRSGTMPLDAFKAIVSPVQVFSKNLISGDHRTTAITLVLESDSDKDRIIRDVNALIRSLPRNLSAYQIGIPLISKAMADYTRQDFLSLPIVTLLVICMILWLLYKSMAGIFLPVATVVIAMIWTFGLMAMTGSHLSMLTMIVPVFLIAVGTAYCLHVQTEFRAVAAENAADAVKKVFGYQSFPIVLAVITTVAGIGSLMINRITAIREFSLFACFGMVSLMIVLLTFFPAVLSLLPLPSPASKKNKNRLDRLLEAFLQKIIYINLTQQKAAIGVIGLMTVICAAGIFFIRVETSPVDFFKPDTPASRHFHDIYHHLSGSFPVNAVVAGKTEYAFEDLENIKKLVRIQRHMETLDGVDKTVSFADYLMLVNYTMNQYDKSYYALPQEAFELRMLINNFKVVLGADFLNRFMSQDFSKANILMLTHISSSTDFLKTENKLQDYFQTEGLQSFTLDVTGLGMVIAASSHLLTTGQVKSLSISLVLIFAIMVFLFLSGKVGLIALLPNIFPILINFGIMGWMGIELSVATSLIASIAIGLAVDDTIHYLVRYNREFKKDLDKDRALSDTIMSVGKPIIFTTLTIGIGFSVLLFSHFQPTSIFGMMMMVTLFSALVGDLILLPVLMMHVELVTAWDLFKLMPTLGPMTPGIAHELNQPLNAIKVGSAFLKMMVKKGDKIEPRHLSRVTNEISRQVDRASEMVRHLSEAGRKTGLQKENIVINQSIRSALAIVGNQLKLDSIRLDLDLDENLPLIYASHNRMVQVTFNLLSNASDAINLKGHEGPEDRIIAISTFERNARVIYKVSDSGAGIPDHLKDRIFEPFFTTKEVGRGRGLGLTISRQIVKDVEGDIKAESVKGSGTTITITFPVRVR